VEMFRAYDRRIIRARCSSRCTHFGFLRHFTFAFCGELLLLFVFAPAALD